MMSAKCPQCDRWVEAYDVGIEPDGCGGQIETSTYNCKRCHYCFRYTIRRDKYEICMEGLNKHWERSCVVKDDTDEIEELKKRVGDLEIKYRLIGGWIECFKRGLSR